VATLALGDAPRTAEFLGSAPSADPQSQGTGFLVLWREPNRPPGTALIASLTGDGAPAPAWLIPAAAVIYHEGAAWVYVLEEKDTFERHRIQIGRTVGGDLAVTSGLEEHAAVVIRGAQQLLSAELLGGGAPAKD
jgi:hypothetical protein